MRSIPPTHNHTHFINMVFTLHAFYFLLLLFRGSYEEYFRYYCLIMDSIFKRARGKCDTILMIFDVGKTIQKNLDLSVTKNQISLVLNMFPERIYRLYIVNVDFFIRTVWAIVKSLMEKRTIEKVPFRMMGREGRADRNGI